jgi:gamma-glutamylcyclotransferase (GGCT)/AIG2-like uncharacterized protein YtfP
MDSGDKIKAWVYVAGNKLLEMVGVFEEIPNGDWYDRKV